MITGMLTNNYSRLQLQGKINMTENQALEYRVRNWRELDKEDNQVVKDTAEDHKQD